MSQHTKTKNILTAETNFKNRNLVENVFRVHRNIIRTTMVSPQSFREISTHFFFPYVHFTDEFRAQHNCLFYTQTRVEKNISETSENVQLTRALDDSKIEKTFSENRSSKDE